LQEAVLGTFNLSGIGVGNTHNRKGATLDSLHNLRLAVRFMIETQQMQNSMEKQMN
jgi:hypothetical protein